MNISKLFKKTEPEQIIGIDLGTTNSCVSIIENGKPFIIPDNKGFKTIPSIVLIDNNEVFVGRNATNKIHKQNKSSNIPFTEIKRFIGLKYNNETVKKEQLYVPYNIVNNNNNICVSSLTTPQYIYSPEEISSYILFELKCIAEQYLKKKISKAVVTIPAYFNENQRKATIDAGKIIGLEIVRLINEPTSAAIAYSIDKLKTHQKILVYDIGGGTLDVSLLDICDGLINTIGTFGNTHLGGSDFDAELMNYCLKSFACLNNFEKLKLSDLSSNIIAELKNKCEIAKIELTTKISTMIVIKQFHNSVDLLLPLTQNTLESIFFELVLLCLKPIKELFDICDVTKDEIDAIIMVGGMSRLPMLRKNIKLYFGKEPNISVNPDEIVAMGAGIVAHKIMFPNSGVNENDEITIIDTIPLSLGVDVLGKMSIIIPRGCSIPVTKTKIYGKTNAKDSEIFIKIYEGERIFVKDNFHIGEFILSINDTKISDNNIEDQIEVQFSVDINGMVNVTAKSLLHGSINTVSLTTNGRLNSDQLRKIIKKSQKMKIIDNRKMDTLNAKNELELLIDLLNKNGANINIIIPETTTEIIETHTILNVKYKSIIDKINTSNSNINISDSTCVFENIDKPNNLIEEKKSELLMLCEFISTVDKLNKTSNDENISLISCTKKWMETNHTIIEWTEKISNLEIYCDNVSKVYVQKKILKGLLTELDTLLKKDKNSPYFDEFTEWLMIEKTNENTDIDNIIYECNRKIGILKN